jgi:hypothetical protein
MLVGDFWALFNIHPVGDVFDVARGAAVTLTVFLGMAAQVQVQLAIRPLVLQHYLVDGFMANARSAFSLLLFCSGLHCCPNHVLLLSASSGVNLMVLGLSAWRCWALACACLCR